MSLGETYVIRIYRRGEPAARDVGTPPQRPSSDRAELIGVLEDPVSGETRAFHGTSELVAMLCERQG